MPVLVVRVAASGLRHDQGAVELFRPTGLLQAVLLLVLP